MGATDGTFDADTGESRAPPPIPASELPPSSSSTISLVTATVLERYQSWHINSHSWRGALSVSQYLSREAHLGDQLLTRDGKITYWILTDTSLPVGRDGARPILASCETLRKEGYLASNGRLKTLVTHGIGSVFCRQEYRGRGYASRMMTEIGKMLETWQQEEGTTASFSMLWSDIGRSFYAAHGWKAMSSTHLSLPALSRQMYAKPNDQPDYSRIRPLYVQDLQNRICPKATALLEAQLRVRSEQRPDILHIAIRPDYHHMEWHFARDDWTARALYDREPHIRGAEDPGTGCALIWCRTYGESPQNNKLYILHTIIPTDAGGDVKGSIAALLLKAQMEAKAWDMHGGVELWNPAAEAIRAAQFLAGEENVQTIIRDKESICSLRWVGECDDGVEWVANERFRNPASPNNIIQIQNGTFYRQHPNGTGSGTLQDLDPPLFPNLDFSLSAFPRRRDAGNWKEQQHWAIVGAGGTTTFLEVLRGTHICLPPNARAFPYLSSKDIEAKDDRQRSPFHAIQYVGFTPSKAQGLGAGTRGSYLSARYESRREETDWSVIQYLKGQTQLNPPEKLLGRYTCFDKLLSQVIHDLKLERLTSMPVSNLSNGQARRARIAKALLGRPEVLLLDGPFMGLDPPTLISLSPMLRELAYKSSPRLIMSLRPQDPIPDWITHLAILGRDYTLALAGIKEEVLFAVHRWVNAYNSHRSGIAEKMAALMTEKYGPPPTDVGNTLSTNGVFPYNTYSKIMSSTDPSYIQPTGEVIPEHLSRTNETIWRKAAGKRREKADLDDLLALTCLLPADFSPGEDTRTSLAKVANIDQAPTDKTLKHENEMPLESTNMDPLIELKNVVVSYGSRTVLGQGIQSGFSTGGINFTVRQGTRLALLGPNGSGKTTFLSLLTSDHPQSYSLPIRYFGRSRLASQGKPGLSLWEIQTRIGHSSPEIHTFFPTGLTIRRSLESAWADTFSAKPKLTNVAKRLVDAFLRWWEPELNPCYSPPTLFTSCNAPIDDWIAKSYPPFKYPAKVDDPLAWACSTSNTFGTLPFQSQRLLLFLRAVIKDPDVVILDEAFSGFSPEARDKAMLFLRAGERLVLHRPLIPAHGRLEVNEEDRAQQRSPSENTRNKRVDVEKICREMNITVDDLLGEEKLTTETGRIVHELRRLTHDQLVDMADSNNPPSDYAFTGLSSQQALIVVSHVREEIPDVVNEYMRLPGEEEWKTFNFFDVSQVPVPADDDGSYVFSNELRCLTTGSDSLFLGDSDGKVRILSRALRVVRSFQAAEPSSHASVTHLKQIESTSLLVTITEDLSTDPALKVWALDQEEKKTKGPKCLSATGVQNGRRQFPISAFVALEDLSQVAVGFGNGAVTVIRGDLIHDRGSKQRTVFESEEPVTGLAIREGTTTVLYIATTNRLASLVISGRGQGQAARTVDNRGCGIGCMSIAKDTKDVIIARDDAVYYYGPSGRGPSFAFDGPKRMVTTFKDYVGLVCPPRVAQLSKSKTYRRLGGSEMDDLFSTSSFSLLETDLRYIAHTESLPTEVKEVFSGWGELFLLTIDGKLYRYQEKTLQQKLDILSQRNLFILAINIAQKAGVDTATQNIIFRKYGDHLYQKGDYDTAMQQYLRAIDNTEPSQILRKFLDTQRIHNLIEYLEELHDHDKATADHTTLLLNCYAKLKDTEKLDAFIRAPGELKFDLETAISMCRQGGYFEQAAYLAIKHGENSLVVDILIEDSKKYTEALAYIRQLEPLAAYPNFMKYARVLLEHCPDETTSLFIDYYTGRYRPKEEAAASPEPQPQSQASAFQNLSALLPLPYMNRSTIAASSPEAQQQTTIADVKLASKTDTPPPEYPVPTPRTAFSCFIPHPSHFIRFLEALASQNDVSSTDKTDLYTTLFEIYLEQANSEFTPASEREVCQEKAKELITSQPQVSTASSESIDAVPTSSVLLLSSLSNFATGTTLVRERVNLYADILRSHISANDTSGAISALRKYGPKDPTLYPIALTYFSSSTQVLASPGVKDELQAILGKIDQDNLMAPLQVVKALSKGGAVTMGMVKPFLSESIKRERKEIQNNRALIESYRSETAAKKSELDDLGSKPIVFQARRCSSCGANLDLPTVHFLCKHSFHQRCLNSGASSGTEAAAKADCPLCKPQNDTIKAIRRAQVESTEHHELFKAALDRSTQRFGTVSEFFGKGVMNVVGPGAITE